MAQHFFNRHNGSTAVEPFSESKYSTQDYYYKIANGLSPSCDNPSFTNDVIGQNNYNPQSSRCGKDAFPTTSIPSGELGHFAQENSKINVINNCLCKYKNNVDTYLQKTNADKTINGTTNDNTEKYSEMTLKNINLGIGIGMMMIYIYVTNQ